MARIAILTVSDSGAAGGREDVSGDTAERRCIEAGHTLAARSIVADEREAIAGKLREWADSGIADWVITTGGTGLTERDVTPEATRDVAERDVPGVPVALWVNGLKQTPFAALSRGVAVQRRRTVIVNLPGNPKAVADGMDVLVPLFSHAARLLAGPMEHTTAADSGRS